jgi:mono/diheme cytochrome c family protein
VKKTDIFFIAFIVAITAIGLWWYGLTPPDDGGKLDINNAELVALGKSLYGRECATCHGKNLEGQPNWQVKLPDGTLPAPPHDGTGHTWQHSDDNLFEITKFGRLKSAHDETPSTMPAFNGKLSDDEIWAVLTYIKSRWPEDVRVRHGAINRRFGSR